MRFTFHVGDVWVQRDYPQPFEIERLDLLGNVFCRYLYLRNSGLTTRVEYIELYRPLRLVGRCRRLLFWLLGAA